MGRTCVLLSTGIPITVSRVSIPVALGRDPLRIADAISSSGTEHLVPMWPAVSDDYDVFVIKLVYTLLNVV